MKKRTIAILVGTMCLTAPSAYAQKNLVKGLTEALSSKAPAAVTSAVSAQVERQVARATLRARPEMIITRTGTYFYHPVFGYVPSPNVPFYYPDIHFATRKTLPKKDEELIQKRPLFKHELDPIHIGARAAFELGGDIDFETITKAAYFWRVAHPEKSLEKNPYLYEWAKLHIKQIQEEQPFGERIMWEFPNYLLLKHLLDPHFTPTSFAQLYELTPVYPKHITLNDYGFPVKTADDDYADILDAYLMLSNPKQMDQYNTYGKYTPFVLTPEEHAAADKLLALREQGEKLPANPTPRDVLEVAYNRLETHTAPYSQIDIEDMQSGFYRAYPNYKNTQLYRTIKGMIKGQIPLESYHQGYYTLENVDMTHLIVLDAVMSGVDQQDLMEVRRALSAFDKLCADVHPDAEQLIWHLAILQKNLRVVFKELLELNDLKIDWATGQDPRWQKAELANYAYSVLERPVRELVGRNWKQRY